MKLIEMVTIVVTMCKDLLFRVMLLALFLSLKIFSLINLKVLFIFYNTY